MSLLRKLIPLLLCTTLWAQTKQQLGDNFVQGQLSLSHISAPGVAGLCLVSDGNGGVTLATCGSGGGGSGTVTSFSAGNLPPLFTTSVATSTTTPALTFILSNFAAHTFLGNNTGSSAAPVAVQPKTIDLADFSPTAPTTSGKIPIFDQPSGTYIPGDPLVQGLFADLSTSAANPIAIGGYDTAGTPVLHKSILLNGNPAGTEYGLVTRNIPSGTQTVSGSVSVSNFPGTQPVSGTITVQQATASNLNANIGNFPATQTVAGTVTANAGTGTFNNQQSNVTLDYDTGAGTQNLTIFGIALPANGGAVAGGTATNPLRIDPTGTTTQPVNGTVTANAGTGTFNIQSNASVNLNQVGGTALSAANVVDAANAAFKVNCVTGCSSTPGFTDNTAFTAGTTTEANVGGVFNDGLTAVTSGNAAAARITNNRAIHINIRNASGTELATASNPVRTDPTGTTTQPISGTITANIGTTNGLALDTSVTGLQVAQGSTTSGQKGALALGAVTTAAPSYTTAQSDPLSLDTSGNLRTSVNNTVTVSGTVTTTPPSNASTNVAQFGGTNVSTGTGAGGTGIPRVTVSNDSAVNQTIGTSGFGKVTDGTNTAAVKAASTAPTATDPALVVALSPNSPSSAVADRNVTGSLVNVNDTVSVNTQGMSTVGWSTSGTGVGTITQEVTYDNTTWFIVQTFDSNISKNFLVPSSTAGTGIWSQGLNNDPWITNVAGAQQFRLRLVSITSGTFSVVLNASVATSVVPVYQSNAANLQAQVQGNVASAAADSGNPVKVGGVFNQQNNSPYLLAPLSLQNGQRADLQVDPFGRLIVVDPYVIGLQQQIAQQGSRQAVPILGSFGRRVTSTQDALDVNVKYPPASADPCSGDKTNLAISQTTNTQLGIAVPGRIRICSIMIISATAQSFSLVEGTGSTCGTGTLAIVGSTTAANGPSVAANSGYSQGNGQGTIARQAGFGNNLCLLQSGSGVIAGNLTWVAAP